MICQTGISKQTYRQNIWSFLIDILPFIIHYIKIIIIFAVQMKDKTLSLCDDVYK